MNKNDLIKVLGIESINKRNRSKDKPLSTLLQIIVDYFLQLKAKKIQKSATVSKSKEASLPIQASASAQNTKKKSSKSSKLAKEEEAEEVVSLFKSPEAFRQSKTEQILSLKAEETGLDSELGEAEREHEHNKKIDENMFRKLKERGWKAAEAENEDEDALDDLEQYMQIQAIPSESKQTSHTQVEEEKTSIPKKEPAYKEYNQFLDDDIKPITSHLNTNNPTSHFKSERNYQYSHTQDYLNDPILKIHINQFLLNNPPSPVSFHNSNAINTLLFGNTVKSFPLSWKQGSFCFFLLACRDLF
jgi:hypothetical protein